MVRLTLVMGLLTYISLLTTFTLGFMTSRNRAFLKYHKFFAFSTVIFATIHVTLIIKLLYF